MKRMLILLPAGLLLASCGRGRVETYRVPKSKPSAEAQRAAPAETAAPAPAAGFTAALPAGWREVPPSSAMREASYTIEGTGIDFYLISLSMGDVQSNVNRWRGQVGLSAASLEEIEQDMQVFTAGGRECRYFEIYNEENGRGIIAAIIERAPNYWYFTGKGTVDELKAHAGEMQAFLQSIQFNGGGDE